MITTIHLNKLNKAASLSHTLISCILSPNLHCPRAGTGPIYSFPSVKTNPNRCISIACSVGAVAEKTSRFRPGSCPPSMANSCEATASKARRSAWSCVVSGVDSKWETTSISRSSAASSCRVFISTYFLPCACATSNAVSCACRYVASSLSVEASIVVRAGGAAILALSQNALGLLEDLTLRGRALMTMLISKFASWVKGYGTYEVWMWQYYCVKQEQYIRVYVLIMVEKRDCVSSVILLGHRRMSIYSYLVYTIYTSIICPLTRKYLIFVHISKNESSCLFLVLFPPPGPYICITSQSITLPSQETAPSSKMCRQERSLSCWIESQGKSHPRHRENGDPRSRPRTPPRNNRPYFSGLLTNGFP